MITAGSVLAPGILCSRSLAFTIPNDPALCNTLITDRADIALEYAAVRAAVGGRCVRNAHDCSGVRA